MREALADPAIFGDVLPGETWAAWRVLLIASRGERLLDAERSIFTALTGRECEPEAPVEELWGIVGRRGGKSRAFSVLGAYLAALVDYSAVQAPGERLKLAIMASTTNQATKLFTYAKGLFEHSPELRGMVDGDPTADTIRLTSGVDIEVKPANYRTVRGDTLVGALCDEIAHWLLEGVNPDTAVLEAIRPGLATTGGPLCALSTPYASRGEMYAAFKRDFGPEGDPAILVARAPSTTMNPSLDPAVVKRAYTRDPVAAAAEYGAEFRSDVAAFVSREIVEAAVPPGLFERMPLPKVTYAAFTDPSGGASDSMTIAIAHREGDRIFLDAVRERKAPFSPESVVREFADLLGRYGIKAVTGDRYAGEWPAEAFSRHGIKYLPAEQSKSELYVDMLPKLNSGEVELLDIPVLVNQLVGLERRTSRGGRDSIDHAPKAHDDVANAVAGAIILSKGKEQRIIRFTPELIERLAGPKKRPHQMFSRRKI
jgi:hypothetical protein